jgi:hypothetical protein
MITLVRRNRMRLVYVYSFVLPLLLSNIGQTYAAGCSTKSATHIVPLLELYTSEGCSSCPPADKWLSGLDTNTVQVTPLAFHVDYWNYIGWQDKFSKAEYSNRQRKIAAFNAAGFVYTPQFVLNGRDFKGWDNSRLRQAAEKSKQQLARAQLQLDFVPLSNGQVGNGDIALRVMANTPEGSVAKQSDIFIALYENKLVSKINAGENNGKELHHDYVVRDFLGPYQMNNLNQFNKQFTLHKAWQQRDGGAVIFVQNSQTGEILQSLALRFCQ